MKYLITESRLDDVIYKYLTTTYYPDYDWGPELHDFYRTDVKKYGVFDFYINDRLSYTYVGVDDYYSWCDGMSLIVEHHIFENLDNLFGDSWKPVFVKWFEDNTGLPVKHFRLN